jgi:hypothetical protein
MFEETLQVIIVTALAIAPVLYIFLRKWVSRHGGLRRKKRPKLAPLPPRNNEEPRPILNRLGSGLDAEDGDNEGRPRSTAGGLSDWVSYGGNGDLLPESEVGAGPQAVEIPGSRDAAAGSPHGGLPPAAREAASALAWRRIDHLPDLQRAVLLSEVLSRPRALKPWSETSLE